MTSAAPELQQGSLETTARELRQRHAISERPPRAIPVWAELRALRGWLERARAACAEPGPGATKAAEWLLDNDYLAQRAIAQIQQDLPPGFYARLPALASHEGEGLPRAFALAKGLLRASRLQLSLAAAIRFVDAYQDGRTWLSIAELWAFPTLLRLACLELLVSSFERLVPGLEAPCEPTAGSAAPEGLEDTECVARALANLGAIASIPWKDFFAAASRVEAILCGDPVRVFPRMDFETRDRYRKAVEELAKGSGRSEPEVAERVVARARQALSGDPKAGHVGQWLVAAGREELERSLGYRPGLRARSGRWLRRRAGLLYAASLCAATGAVAALPAAYLLALGAGPLAFGLGTALALLPASILGVTLVHWVATRIAPPRVLPKLDFEKGIPGPCAAAVVVPCLVGSRAEARELLERLEGHYLANPDPRLQFALLSDWPDAPSETMPGDAALVQALAEGIRRLNSAHGEGGRGPFHVLHRPRLYNPAEGCWMGWERKRGKLEELNRLVSRGEGGGFSLHEGDREALRGVRFVVTVDADTLLPPGSVARLVGTLAHPLNRAEFDADTGRVHSGFTVVQPRVEISPESGNRSLFARLYSGDTAIDIYTRAVSDVYQDLFGTGIYVGKGVYEVEAFRRSLEGRVPENALASHDLFEGLHGRAALASDIVLYESFPSGYLAFARRWHRWVRGDWQLLPWLGRRVPAPDGGRLPNRIAGLGRWKILDNLRRSLMPVALVALLAAGWLALPGSPGVWTALAVAAPGAALFTDLVTGLAGGRRRGAVRRALPGLRDHAGRWFLAITFLANDAAIALDAALRTLRRLRVTRQGLLEWTSAAHTAARLARRSSRAAVWREMWIAPALSLALAGAMALLRPAALPWAAPLLLLWLAAPEIAERTSRPRRPREEALGAEERAFLRRLARRTWLFFESFVGPDDHWLPPDNFQEEPRGEIAHRTSPTNIGMMFLSSLAAADLGYLGLPELAARLRSSLDSLGRMDRYRGHVLNWIDTRSLASLEPRYVSTVDSGNLAVSLIALKEGCRELALGPALRREAWEGLADVLVLLGKALASLPGGEPGVLSRIAAIGERAGRARGSPRAWRAALADLCERDCPELQGMLLGAIERPARPQPQALREIRVWLERLHHHLRGMQRDFETLAPWLEALERAPRGCEELAGTLAELLPPHLPLAELAQRCADARKLLGEAVALGHGDAGAAAWLADLDAAIEKGSRHGRDLRDALLEIATRAEDEAWGMDFRLLFDAESRLFHIGYNVSSDRLDPHHYDLLASEARLASFFAIAKGDVPLEHWFFLGRPVTRSAGELALVSWGGSMFEYLMPPLLLRSGPGTLLAQSERVAVEAQRRYAERLGVPWGMSESGFASLDPDHHYRYRSFGVPGLGLRRGLSRDLVVAPYASALALPIRAGAAVENLRELERLGMVGFYGLFEAADFTPERAARETRFSPVQSYMSHHQGMILAALANALAQGALVRRFHADRRMRTAELLLHERIPLELPPESVRAAEQAGPAPRRPALPAPGPWVPTGRETSPQVLGLGNGRLASWISEAGAGALRWNEYALTRFLPDATRDDHGLWIYVRDEESGAVWSAGRQPTGVAAEGASAVFHPHMAELHRRNHGIALGMEIAVVPGDDVEVRWLSVTNETDRARRLCFTSYAEVVLAPPLEDERHPAFSKLFVEGEYVPELEALLFARRPRSPREQPPVLLHRVVSGEPALRVCGFETDRRAFLGRHGDPRRPHGVVAGLTDRTGFTLDPAMALQVRLELEPQERRQLAFLTLVAGSRESALELAERYSTLPSLAWAISDASVEAAREVQRLGLEPARLPDLQRLASLLVHPHPALRARPAALVANELGQPRLWGLGISGDLPILLLRAGDSREPGLLRSLVRGHQLWSRHGLAVDLVVLRTGISGYAEPLREQLFALIQEIGAGELLGRPGGIHLLLADQMGEAEQRLLEVAARVVLDDAHPLEHQLALAPAPAPPPFAPAGAPTGEPTPALRRPVDLLFDNGFGGFAEGGREYVVHLEPGEATPAPWCNVLANDGFGCVVSEAGGGFTWAENSGENRLTPWGNDPVLDPPGEVLYLRDEETGEIWTPTPQPAGADAACQIRHGAGYTEWRQQSHGLEQRLLVFVAKDAPVKVARLRLRNLWPRPRRVTATYSVEWLLGALRSTARPFVVCEYDPGCRALLARNPWNPEFAARVAFLTSTLPPHGLTADREEFLGREGDPRRPAALSRWGLSGRDRPGADPAGVLQVHLDLEPEGAAEVAFALGQGRDREEARELALHWREPERIDRAFGEVGRHWDAELGAVQVHTPDAAFDVLVNRWLLYQARSSRLLARAGFYQAGGAIGFRDQLQDVLALLFSDPARTRSHLLLCAAHQFEEGDVLHWWHPNSGRGVRTRCSDDLLWLPYAASCYVEATGDESVLDEEVPFLRAPPLAPEEHDRYASFEITRERRTLLEHCERALERGDTRGAHGLPLIGSGDWNDGFDRLGRGGRGESVWLGFFAIAAMRGFAGLCLRRNRKDLALRWRGRARELAEALEEAGWDGEWYRRAFDDEGRPIGSAAEDECRIDSVAQSWAVLSGAAPPERARRALLSAERELVAEPERLIRLLWPPFDATPRDPGYIKAYPPGIRENGGQYTHAAAWLGLALAALGDGERAWRSFDLLQPIRHAATRADALLYRVEPYVLAADIASAGPRTGLGGWTWYTGSAAWTWRLAVEGILGLRLEEGRLAIDPCLPPGWGSFEAELRGPSGALAIRVEDPERVGRGPSQVRVDGVPCDDGRVELPTDGSLRRVEVRLGASEPALSAGGPRP